MLSGGTCARLFGFRSEGVEVGVGVVVRRIDLLIGTLSKRLEARRRGGGGNEYASQTLHAKFHTPVKHNLMSGW